jgi:predicted transcriptional regulator
MAKLFGKNAAVDFAAANLMSFGKSFSRLNGQPLDKSEVWYDNLQALRDYALTDAAYVGQKVVYVDSTNNTVTHYGIETDGSLKELGSSLVGDNKSIVVAENGTISLKGVPGLDFVKKDENGDAVKDDEGNEVKINYQPLMTEAGLIWVVPSATTVEGLAAEIEGLKSRATALEVAVGNAEGGLVKDVADLDGRIAQVEKDIEDIESNSLKQEDKTELNNAIDAKLASITASDASVVIGGTATAPTIGVKVSADAGNALVLAEDGLMVTVPAAEQYSIVKDEVAADGCAATYHLTKGGVNVGAAINIPKDMVIQSGTIVTNPEGQAEGTYIKLVLANADNSELFIPVDSLIEYVTSGSHDGDMVVIAIDETHKVTATITNGSITAEKLHADVQAILNKAHEHENKTLLDAITAEKVAAWDVAEQNAKDYADDLNDAVNLALDGKVAVEEGKSLIADTLIAKLEGIEDGAQVNAIDTVEETEFTLDGKKLSMKAIAMDKVTGLADALDNKVTVEDGKSLVSDTLISKLEGIAEGAQVNVIDSVDTTQFNIDSDKKLTLLDITMSKVSGLQDALDAKANKGTTLSDYGITDAYTKTETEGRLQEIIDGLSDTSETAASVAQALETYKTSNDQRVDTIEAKLAGIDEGAQVNVIEAIKLGDTLLEVADKTVTIPAYAGLKASDEVTVAEDGKLGIGEVNVNKLVQNEDEYLVLNGGAAALL